MAEREERSGQQPHEVTVGSGGGAHGLRGVPDRKAIAVFDESGLVVVWTRAAERFLGVERAAILGRSVTELLTLVDVKDLTEGVTVGPVGEGDPPGRWGLWPAGPLPGGIRSGVLDAVFTQSPVGLHVLDADLRVLRINSAAAGMRGTTSERDVVGRPFSEVYSRFGPGGMEDDLREVLASGVPLFEQRVAGYPRADPAHEHVFSVSVFRLEDDLGRPLGLVASAVDVTARDRARERLAVLHRVHARMGLRLDAVQCARELVRAVVPTFADVATVALTSAELHGPGTDVGSGDATLRCVAGWPPEADEVLGVGAALDLPDHDARGSAPYVEESDGVGPTLVVPLTARGVLLGVAHLSRPRRPDPFEDDDLRLAADLAAHTSVCVDNARRYEHDHAVALALKGNLVRSGRTGRSTMETAHRYLPSGLGTGAWFDVLPLSGNRVALAVGHIAGTGPDAMAAMVQLRSAIQVLSTLDLDPHDLLDDTTRRLGEERTAAGTGGPLTAQCVYAVHDPVTETCAIARAGDQTVLVGHPDGGGWHGPLEETTELGGEGPPFAADEIPAPPGSILVLLSGRADPGEPELAALRARLAGAGPPRPLSASDLHDLPLDQAAVLVARTRALFGDDVACREVAPEPTAASEARRWAVRLLEDWGLRETAFAVELIVSELVTNAIRHGVPPIHLRIIRNTADHTVTCEISDTGRAAPHLRRARAADEGGRGIFISGELSDRWGVRWTERGKTVWTETSYTP
ncbi:PAS domain-containing protein [Streptomyces sp. NPDC096030]|uniref:PAS domain-containing protein n=1 Tax=Streptomyces sp. NPDC096030 TaxID=3155423 RepID=UPI0033173D5C